jgi:uncharacterized phiE125 gp8 family phage protein
MSDLYVLKTAGAVPVLLADMKLYMKVTAAADDDLITSMLAAATTWGENYTGREFRANTWTLLTDDFSDRMCLYRAPVATITTIKYLVSDVLTTIANTVYYLKKNLQFAEILLKEDQLWPTDIDAREQAIEIEFVTESYRDTDAIATAIMRHVAYWYKNRGDCGSSSSAGCSCGDAAKGSGVTAIYDQFRIDRV